MSERNGVLQASAFLLIIRVPPEFCFALSTDNGTAVRLRVTLLLPAQLPAAYRSRERFGRYPNNPFGLHVRCKTGQLRRRHVDCNEWSDKTKDDYSLHC